MELIHPCMAYLESYRSAVAEDRLYRPGAEVLFGDPDSIIEKAFNYEHGINLKPGYVKATTLWLVDRGRFIGEVGIRHELTPALLRYGGNIGYEIRCSESNKGYGTAMLKMALAFCRKELGLERVLLTCDDDNSASAKVIENNGGILGNKVRNQTDRGEVLSRRYWIEI